MAGFDDLSDQEIDAAILDNVRDGLMEFDSVGPDGSIRYRLTELGWAVHRASQEEGES